MNTERDKFLTEAMGESWHRCDEWAFYCEQCAKNVPISEDFSTWEGFGKLFEFSKNQIWWKKFRLINHSLPDLFNVGLLNEDLIDPNSFADAIYEFLNDYYV